MAVSERIASFLQARSRALTVFFISALVYSCLCKVDSSTNQAVIKIQSQTCPRLEDITIEDISEGFASNLFSSVDLVTAYLRRIQQVNPIVNAVVEISTDSIEVARKLDEARLQGVNYGPLHGVPVLVKNNIGTFNMNNTAGSSALLGAKLRRDATVIAKLRKAGAIILGKSNMSQWANYRSSSKSSSDGWSAHGGQAYGPFYPGQNPSGSSTGSAIATSLGFALGSIGTDTMGSIGSPSQKCATVGISPTMGLTSRDLVIPFSEHQDSVGTMARTVKDAAHLLHAIAGQDKNDNYTEAIPFDRIPYYPAACRLISLKGTRIGVPRSTIVETAENFPVIASFNKSLEILRTLGAEIVENTNFATWKDDIYTPNATIVYGLDFKTGLKKYLSQLETNPKSIHTLDDLIEYTKHAPEEEYPQRNIDLWLEAASMPCDDNTCEYFWKAYSGHYWHGTVGGVTGAIERYDLDALVLPTDFANHPAGPAGLPIITVPMGFYPDDSPLVKGRGGLLDRAPRIPFSIGIVGTQWSEEKLIKIAYNYEQSTMVRELTKPYIMPNIEL